MTRTAAPRFAPRRWWQHPHRGNVWALATHPDHDGLLVGSASPSGSLWALLGDVARSLGDAPDVLRDAAWAGSSRVVLAVEARSPGGAVGPLRVVVRDVAGAAPDRVVAELPDAGYRTTLTVDRAGERALVNTSHAMHLVDLRGGGVRTFDAFQGDRAGVVGGALSPDGALAVTARAVAERVRLYDVGAERFVFNLQGEATGGVVAACFSPTGTLAAALLLGARRLVVWSIPDGVLRFAREGLTDLPPALAFSPDGARLAVSEHGHGLLLLDTRDGAVVAKTKTLDGYALRLAFARDGRALYVADDTEVHVVPLAGDAPPVPRVAPVGPRVFETLLAGNDFSYHTGGCVDGKGNPWIVGQNGSVLTSRDDGLTWTRVPLGKRTYLYGACEGADGAMHLFGKGATATVRDGVVTVTPTSAKATVVAMASSREVTVALGWSSLMRRRAGDDAWVADDPAALRGGHHQGVAVDGRGRFFVVSGALGAGFVARGDAAGAAWERLDVAAGCAFWCVACDGERVYVGADAGAVYRSDDGGARWRRLETPVTSGRCAALVARGDVVYAAFDGGELHRSDDGGARWTRVLVADAQRLVWTPTGRVLAVGSGALYGCRDVGVGAVTDDARRSDPRR